MINVGVIIHVSSRQKYSLRHLSALLTRLTINDVRRIKDIAYTIVHF